MRSRRRWFGLVSNHPNTGVDVLLGPNGVTARGAWEVAVSGGLWMNSNVVAMHQTSLVRWNVGLEKTTNAAAAAAAVEVAVRWWRRRQASNAAVYGGDGDAFGLAWKAACGADSAGQSASSAPVPCALSSADWPCPPFGRCEH